MKLKKSAAISSGIFALLVMAAFILLPVAREKARRISCSSNLKSVGLSLMQYTMDNGNEFPDKDGAAGWELLRSNDYLTDYKIYTCPSSLTLSEKKGFLCEASISYVYFGGFSAKDTPGIPLAFDKLGNHKNFVNILFVDGHVEGIPGNFNSYSDVINMLKKRYGYSAEDVKRLDEKAARLDGK